VASNWEASLPHRPVLYHEIIHALRPHHTGLYIDGTVGAGGHAWGILHASAPHGQLLGLDLDPVAIALARQRLAEFAPRVTLVQASYTTLRQQAAQLGWTAVDGILLDLGASSMQFDNAERGFSFQQDGPLDMRFSPLASRTAANLVNQLPEDELADLVYQFGEERQSRRVARAIVAARPLHSTTQLAAVIAQAIQGKRGAIHPATRTFQALRIAVNQELDAIDTVLPTALQVLAPGGRLAVISFHSLEDRRVKRYFRQESQDCLCPTEQMLCTCEHQASIKLVSRRALQAGEQEASQNPRARSARLRVAEKL